MTKRRFPALLVNVLLSTVMFPAIAVLPSGVPIQVSGHGQAEPAASPARPQEPAPANSWNALGTGVNGAVLSIGLAGKDTYFAGNFANAGGVAEADEIARWDGSALNNMAEGSSTARVDAIAVAGRGRIPPRQSPTDPPGFIESPHTSITISGLWTIKSAVLFARRALAAG